MRASSTNRFRGGSDSKELACKVEELGPIPGLGRSHGGGLCNPLQCSCLRMPWTKDPGGLQSLGSEADTTGRLSAAVIAITGVTAWSAVNWPWSAE